jgi:hypothetical protein
VSRRRKPEGELISLDSMLNIMTIAVGGLILVAVVTVLGVSDVGVSTGAVALAAPRPSAKRVLFEAAGGKLFAVDEDGNATRVRDAVNQRPTDKALTAETVMEILRDDDVGDASHRVLAEPTPGGLAWVYERRETARGDTLADLAAGTGDFAEVLSSLPSDAFVYVVVHDDSFEVLRRVREMVAARGVAMGWHPVEGDAPIRMGSTGSLGKRVQPVR